jgi:hypothetical protein
MAHHRHTFNRRRDQFSFLAEGSVLPSKDGSFLKSAEDLREKACADVGEMEKN